MTKLRRSVASVVGALALSNGVLAQETGGDWVSLFDGKTLEGWTQLNGKATYEVEDGTIVGHTAAGSPNSFLCTNKHYGDFELEFEVKCDKGLNSGVQIRSLQKGDKPGGRVFGPQVEIAGSPGFSGYIYGEATGLAWLSPGPKAEDKSKARHAHLKNDEWNHYRVVAQGPRIQTFINGNAVADLTHEAVYKTHPAGVIGLQVHAIGKDKGPFKVAWRNLRIRDLK